MAGQTFCVLACPLLPVISLIGLPCLEHSSTLRDQLQLRPSMSTPSYLLSLPHTSSPGSAAGHLRQAAHVGSAREPRVRINSARIWPRAAVRQISVVFNIFRLVHLKAHLGYVVCEGRLVCSEKQFDTGQ